MSYYEPMSLRDAVLAALLEGESSGYDLAKDFDASVANFWMATPQQLYRELERLAEQGLIQARIVEQERRPNKRMFSLTEAGYEAIRQFTGRSPKPSVIRDELMIKVQAVDAGDAAAVRDLIIERREWAEAKVQRYERLRNRILDGRSEGGIPGHGAADRPVSDVDARDLVRGRKHPMGQAGAGDRRTASGRRVRQVVREHRPQPVDELRVGHAGQRRHPEDVAGHGEAEQL